MVKTPCPRQVHGPAQDCRPQPHPGCTKVQREAARGDSAPAPAGGRAGRACQGEQPTLPVRGRMSAMVAPPRPLLHTVLHCCVTTQSWAPAGVDGEGGGAQQQGEQHEAHGDQGHGARPPAVRHSDGQNRMATLDTWRGRGWRS